MAQGGAQVPVQEMDRSDGEGGDVDVGSAGGGWGLGVEMTELESGEKLLEGPELTVNEKNRLPVLIVPGFMSSGLMVESSTVQPRWIGKKLWLSLGRLGFTGKFLGADKNIVVQNSSAAQGDRAQLNMRDDWLAHMLLDTDMTSEQAGVKLKAVPGLDGCEFLESNAMVKADTYVFGKLTEYMVKKGGYVRKVSMDACPYDWRVPFAQLEARDKYMTNTLDRIESLSKANKDKRVVLIAHSMGVNVAHYMLNFAEQQRGRAWIDKHIDTFMPIGGPHLGAAVSTASVVDGDSMGLPSALLKADTALLMGRSFGSTLALQMVQPDGTASRRVAAMKNASLVKRADFLQISVGTIDLSGFKHKFRQSTSIRVRAFVRGQQREAPALTNWVRITGTRVVPPQGGQLEVTIENPHASQGRSLVVQVLLDDLSNENEEDLDLCCCCCPKKFSEACWCIFCCPCFCIAKFVKAPLQGLYLGTANTVDMAIAATQGGSVLCEKEVPLTTFDSARAATGDFLVQIPSTNNVRARHIKGIAKVAMKVRRRTESSFLADAGISLDGNAPTSLPFEVPQSAELLPVTTLDLFRMENLDGHIAQWEKLEKDPLFNTRAPPVARVCSIYGINRETDIRHVFRRCSKGTKNPILKAFKTFELDKKAKLPKDYLDLNKYKMTGGRVRETKNTPQVDLLTGKAMMASGDGTVPYDSLQHVKTWAASCQLDIHEIDDAEHRACLKDKRVMETVLNRCVGLPTEATHSTPHPGTVPGPPNVGTAQAQPSTQESRPPAAPSATETNVAKS